MEMNELLLEIKINGKENMFRDWLFDKSPFIHEKKEIDEEIKKEFNKLKAFVITNIFVLKCGRVNECNFSYDHILMYQNFTNSNKEIDNKEQLKYLINSLLIFKVIDLVQIFDKNYNLKLLAEEENFRIANEFGYSNDSGYIQYKNRYVNEKGYNIQCKCVDLTKILIEV